MLSMLGNLCYAIYAMQSMLCNLCFQSVLCNLDLWLLEELWAGTTWDYLRGHRRRQSRGRLVQIRGRLLGHWGCRAAITRQVRTPQVQALFGE